MKLRKKNPLKNKKFGKAQEHHYFQSENIIRWLQF